MNNKTLTIGFLSISGLILLLVNLLPIQPMAMAQDSIRDRDYAMTTASSSRGGSIIYVTDNRSGLVAVFVWDATRRALVVRDVRPVSDAFMQ